MKKREIGIDMIKTIAICMVSGLHFFLNTNYYGMQMDYSIMIDEAFVKWLMLSAVALFLLTTGYLQCEKKLTISYYKKLLPILIAYAGISIIYFKEICIRWGISFSPLQNLKQIVMHGKYVYWLIFNDTISK